MLLCCVHAEVMAQVHHHGNRLCAERAPSTCLQWANDETRCCLAMAVPTVTLCPQLPQAG